MENLHLPRVCSLARGTTFCPHCHRAGWRCDDPHPAPRSHHSSSSLASQRCSMRDRRVPVRQTAWPTSQKPLQHLVEKGRGAVLGWV